MTSPRIDEVRFARAREELRRKGLVGWVCCRLNGQLRLDGLGLRRSAGGTYSLSFPRRVDSNGVAHPVFAPASAEVRRAIEDQVLAALRRGAWIT